MLIVDTGPLVAAADRTDEDPLTVSAKTRQRERAEVVRAKEARVALLLGQMVYDRRTALGLTQAELAARTRMSQPQLGSADSSGTPPYDYPKRRMAGWWQVSGR